MAAVFPGSVKTWTDKTDLVDFMTASILNDDIMDELIAMQTAQLKMHFGDGSDGDIDLDEKNTYSFITKSGSIYTLTRDIFADDLTVRNGVTLNANGYKIFATGTVTTEADGGSGGGIIHNDGADGQNGTSMGGGAAGANGGAGSTHAMPANGAGGYDDDGTDGGNEAYAIVAVNGKSGGRGNSDGGAGGIATVIPSSSGGVRNLCAIVKWRIDASGSLVSFGYSAGNGGGGGGINGDFSYSGGGGAGGNGGIIVIVSRVVANNGRISSSGGAGGNGAYADVVGGGGGAGGNGGIIAIACLKRTGNTPIVTGGAGGSGAAEEGRDGDNGNAGLFIEL